MPFGRKSRRSRSADSSPSEPKLIIQVASSAHDLARDLSNGPLGKLPPLKVISQGSSVAKRPAESQEGTLRMSLPELQAKKVKLPKPKTPKQIPANDSPGLPKQCTECHTTETSTWRRDPLGNLICNKCGLRKRKDHKAPSRRLIRQPRDSLTDMAGNPVAQDPLASEVAVVKVESPLVPNTLAAPMVDPRPPRPWINHTDRKPSKPPAPSESVPATTAVMGDLTAAKPQPEPASTGTTKKKATPGVVGHIHPVTGVTKTVTPSRRPGPKKAVNPLTLEPKVCSSCGVDESPAWRKGRDGMPLCNKCMLRQKRAAERMGGKLQTPSPTSSFMHGTPHFPARGMSIQASTTGGYAASFPLSTPPAPAQPATRTDSQIVLDSYTHLNSSFTSESGKVPDTCTPHASRAVITHGHSRTQPRPLDSYNHAPSFKISEAVRGAYQPRPGDLTAPPHPQSASESFQSPGTNISAAGSEHIQATVSPVARGPDAHKMTSALELNATPGGLVPHQTTDHPHNSGRHSPEPDLLASEISKSAEWKFIDQHKYSHAPDPSTLIEPEETLSGPLASSTLTKVPAEPMTSTPEMELYNASTREAQDQVTPSGDLDETLNQGSKTHQQCQDIPG